MKSPLNYFGGKSRLASRIVQIIPEHVCYCEPFTGGAWVLFAKEPSQVEVINDRDSELVTFWRVIQHHLSAFLEAYKYSIISRKVFEWEAMKDPATLTDIQRAVRYYYLQRLGFGGHTDKRTYGYGTTRPPGLNLSSLEETLLEVHWRLERVNIECLDGLDCIRRYDRPGTFFFIDPPYYGLSQAYRHKYADADFKALRTALDGVQGKFLLTLNDHPDVRAIFKGFKVKPVSLRYSTGNSRTSATTRSTERRELFITNY